MPLPDPDALACEVARGSRAALARAITLVESRNPAHHASALELLSALPTPHTTTLRVAISGPPGAGKSTLVEALGLAWCQAGRRVAVLAVDPSSGVSRGSVLGDKSRMERLARRDDAFVRPSPTGGHLGGVAVGTRAAVRLVEAAGFDHVLVETVGVGQSETAARQVADLLVLAAQPGSGDEVQGIKRGIMEHADLIAVTKRDALPDAAAAAVRSLRASLSILPPPTADALPPPQRVVSLSSVSGSGVGVLSDRIDVLAGRRRSSGALAERRREQAAGALEPAFFAAVEARIRSRPDFARALGKAQRVASAGDEARALALLIRSIPVVE